MQSSHTFEGKVSMDQIYDKPDPRAYFRKLEGLDYILPGAAKYLIQELVSHLRESRDKAIDILDVGCSYGVNAALLKHDMSMTELYAHWGQTHLDDASSEEVLAYDRRFFSCAEQQADIRVLGLDAAENAVAYAEDVGLLDEGLALDLESEALPAENAADLQAVDLVISTGCVGYVTETTFQRLLPAVFQDEPPWFANFALRTFPFERIAGLLAESGYVTERLEGSTFKQRRFASSEEQAAFLERLESKGFDTSGKEAEGYSHAQFYLSRPKHEADSIPIETLYRNASAESDDSRDVDDECFRAVRVAG